VKPNPIFFPYNKILTALARQNRKKPTPAEHKTWNDALRMQHFSRFKIPRQKPKDNYIVDLYCSELRMVIEIDGDSHDESHAYDAKRTEVSNALGLTVIGCSNTDVMSNIEGIYVRGSGTAC
jgi:very-short-patch-repair endonuclease